MAAPTNLSEWLAWGGIAIPLGGLAWAAIFYTLTRRREVQHQEFERFFKVMDHLGKIDGSIASKMAAAYELRKYPAYKQVIIRLCEQAHVDGVAAEMLRAELKLTADYMRTVR